MSGNLVNHEGGNTADSSNVDLWQQYLAKLNNFKPSAYSSNTEAPSNASAEPGDSVEENTTYEKTDTSLGAGLGEDNEQNAETSPSPNTHEDTQEDEENDESDEDEDYDIIINFDNTHEENSPPNEEDSVSSEKSKSHSLGVMLDINSLTRLSSAATTPYQSLSSPCVNGSRDQQVTPNSESKQEQTASESSRLSANDGNLYKALKSISASLCSDFEYQQLVPAPLFDSMGPLEVYKPESGT